MDLKLDDKLQRLNDLRKQAEVGVRRLIDPPRKYHYLATKNNAYLRPTRIYGLLNDRCNEKCQMCGHWCKDEFVEMTTEQWLRILGELRDFIGPYHINFSGGEPFLRKDIYEILQYCTDRGIIIGVCTNGSAITEKGARHLCEMRLFNYNTSLDGAKPATHNTLRGTDKSYDWVLRGIRRVQQAGKEVGYTPPIVVKPTVCKINLRELPEIVRIGREEGWAAVNFQPMGQWTEPTKPGKGLWIDEEDIPELEAVIEELVEMRQQGYPIWTTEGAMKMMVNHFRNIEPPGRRKWCSIGMTNYTVYANGDVKFCDDFPAVGNVQHTPVQEVWFSEEAELKRQEMTHCTQLCLENCKIERSLKDQLAIFNILRRGRRAN
jgi:MoaA/NifB/PqqE/SkfB family radical SAM enzyme